MRLYKLQMVGGHQTEEGTVYVIKNPKRCKNLGWLIGKRVVINGLKHKVIRVEEKGEREVFEEGEQVEITVGETEQKENGQYGKTIRGIDYL